LPTFAYSNSLEVAETIDLLCKAIELLVLGSNPSGPTETTDS